MPQLVRDGERVRQIVVVVQQHIGVHVAQVAGGERAGGLALGGVHVTPAADAGFAPLVTEMNISGRSLTLKNFRVLPRGSYDFNQAELAP